MRAIKFLLITGFVVSLIFWHRPDTQAKGPVHRILINGGELEKEIAVTDIGLTSLLSFAAFEEFMLGEVEPPQNLGEGYELVRQFKEGVNYHTFDRAMYYPSPDGGRGYVHYLGIENGWSEYDDNWYYAKAEGDMAMQRILSTAHLKPYVMAVTGLGEIYLLDPLSMEQVSSTSLENIKGNDAQWGYVSSIGVTVDGQKILAYSDTGSSEIAYTLNISDDHMLCSTENLGKYLMSSLDGRQLFTQSQAALQIRDAQTLEIQESIALPNETKIFPSSNGLYAIGLYQEAGENFLVKFNPMSGELDKKATPIKTLENPETYQGVWEASFGQFYLTNGEHLMVWDEWSNSVSREFDRIVLRYRDEMKDAGVSFGVVSARDGRLFIYPRLGKYWIYQDNPDFGGIYGIDPFHGTMVKHWQQELAFTHVIEADGRFYALQAKPDSESTQLYMLDTTNGEVLESVDLPADVTYLAYAPLADFNGKILTVCSRVEAGTDAAIISPPTATPAK